MLEVYHSNRLEVLIRTLAEVTAEPLPDAFQAEVVVVQNTGMARWIDQQLALLTGVSARVSYPLPASFFWQVLEAWSPEAPDASVFDKGALLWRVFRLLPDRLEAPSFAPLQRYLRGDTSGLRRFQLARRIADLLDQYLVYRPDRVLGWEQGKETHWQAELWRALGVEAGHGHRARLFADLHAAMAADAPPPSALPQRVSLFGLTALAPAYVRMLGDLARFIPVHVFYLNPCREYWSDLVDERGQARRRARAERAGLPDPTGLLDIGNPLLASVGHAGQVFLDQLLELGGVDHDRFEVPAGTTLLHRVQRDVLELRDPRGDRERPEVPPEDLSIQLHSAHSRLREVQILHDRLLDMFQRLPGLEPRDIIVMAPDIDCYAPYVEATFGAVAAPMRIPWSIADRRAGAEQPLLAALRQLLALPRSRFEASEVLSLLEVPAVQRRVGLDALGLERIRTWVRESGVRWGEDAAMREALGLPAQRANTWAFGLDRLFLGYALPPDPDADPYRDTLPYVDVEGAEVAYLGVLQDFMDRLGQWRKRLTVARRIAEWRAAIDELLADLLVTDEDEESALQGVRDRLDAQVSLAQTTGLDEPLGLDVVRALLDGILDDTPSGAQRFLTGGVTFCNMVPMRSIPFRIVCLIGMNGDDFPRSQRPLSFDLMAEAPRRGDRSRRNDDRYLFLEALLSARDVLYLSYVGRDIRDNSIKVPSVVVSELRDCLSQSCDAPHGAELDEHVLVSHPLQPFGRSYFDGADPRLISFSKTWAAAARAAPGAEVPPFAGAPLSAPDETRRTLDVEELVRFLRNPARYFLTQRLGLRLPKGDEVPGDVEPFDVAGLERYQLRQVLLHQLLAGRDEPAVRAQLRGQGLLPHGTPGDLLLAEQLEVAHPFVERLVQQWGAPEEPLEVDIPVGEYRLQGQLRNLHRDGVVDYRFGKLRCVDRLAVWVRHLVLNVLAPDGVVATSLFLAEDYTFRLLPVKRAEAHLRELLDLRWQGLCAPVAFFPESAFAWLEKEEYGSAFESAWSGARNPAREESDLAVRIAFRGQAAIGEAFETNARRILRPLLDHAETEKPR